MTNYNKTTRPILLQIIRKYNQTIAIPYLKIKNYNHDNKYILVKTCEAIDGGDEAIKAFITGGKVELTEKYNLKIEDKVSIPKAISPVSPVILPVITPPVSPRIDTPPQSPKKETRAEFEARIRAIAKAKYPKNPSSQLRFMIDKCGGVIGGMNIC
jgi:hypothetical protein